MRLIYSLSLPKVTNDNADAQHPGVGLYTYHKYQKALHSPVPLDTHGNPLPQEEAEEILQTAMLLEFPSEEGFIDGDREQYESPGEEGREEETRDEEGGRVKGDAEMLPPPHEIR